MAAYAELNQAAWDEWVSNRPPVIQELCAKLPPDRLYRMKSTGQRVVLLSYSENHTVKVGVDPRFNQDHIARAMTPPYAVFGIPPDDLEECDLPDGAEIEILIEGGE